MAGIVGLYHQITDWFERNISLEDGVIFFIRAYVAQIFYASMRTKSDGFLSFDVENSLFLFEEEYNLPLLDPAVAGQLAVIGETLFPLMLMFGVLTRFGALGLIGMTAVIQFLVYPGSFYEHIVWFAALLAILARGPGRISVDNFVGPMLGFRSK